MSEFLNQIIKDFENITKIVKDVSNIKKRLNSNKNNKSLETELRNAKNVIESLVKEVNSIKTNFYKDYDSVLADICLNNVEELSKEEKENTSEQTNNVLNPVLNNIDTEVDEQNIEQCPASTVSTPIKKPTIRLVDINKLVVPSKIEEKEEEPAPAEVVAVFAPASKRKKSVQFSPSVVIICGSDEDEATSNNLRKRRSLRKSQHKETKLNHSSSDSESESYDKNSMEKKSTRKVQNGKIDKNKRHIVVEISSASSSDEGNDYSPDKDIKFKSKCVVKILRVPCEEMNEFYAQKAKLKEVKSLTNLKSIERIRKPCPKSRQKNRKKIQEEPIKNSSASENEDNSGDHNKLDPNSDLEEKDECDVQTIEEIDPLATSPRSDTANENLAELILNEMDSSNSENNSENSDKEDSANKLSVNSEQMDNSSETNKKESRNKTDKQIDSEDESNDKNEKIIKNEKKKHESTNEKNSKENSDDDSLDSDKEINNKKTSGPSKKTESSDSEKSEEEDSKANQSKKTDDKEKNNASITIDLSSDTEEEELTKKKRNRRKIKKDSSSEEDKKENKKRDTSKKKKRNSLSSGSESDNKVNNKSNSLSDSDEDTAITKKSSKKKKKVLSDTSDNEKDNDKKSSTSSDSDEETKGKAKKSSKKKKKVLTDTDYSEGSDNEKYNDKKSSSSSDSDEKTKEKAKKSKRKKKKVLADTDSEGSSSEKDSDKKSSSSEAEEKETNKTNSKRKRIKKVDDSSDEEEVSTRKHIRKVLQRDDLKETTIAAENEEKKRKARIAEKQKKYNQIFENEGRKSAKVDKVILDFDEETETELLKIDEDLVKQLKPHQAEGVRFMWNACFESIERAKTEKGSGCILAHCMGLGKTLQVIALAHTLLINEDKTKVRKVMVVCPLNTVLNWVNEFKQWLPDNNDYDVYELISAKQNSDKLREIKYWHESGGVLIIGYDMYRNLSNPDNKRYQKKMRMAFAEALVDPGPELVVCDEGHLLKNEKTNLSIAMNRLKTARRIVLTGTPLQNNLKEYYCMVQFVKPNLLGTYKEYLNRFVNPITNGQYTDSTLHDIQVMRRRAHVLYKMLDGLVQRRDYAVLAPYLPPKNEYVLFLTLTETQIKLYEHYMKHFSKRTSGTGKGSFLFVDFQNLQRICTHPRVLLDKCIEDRNKKMFESDEEDSEGSLKDFVVDKSDSSSSSGDSDSSESDKATKPPPKKRVTRATANDDDVVSIHEDDNESAKEWWQQYCDGNELDNIMHSSKLFLLFEILKECEQIGDKILVFSQSLYSLNVIEYFLGKIHDATQDDKDINGYTGSWCLGLDYFRLDGSSSCDNRSAWCKHFNDPNNIRARLFLISTRAGGLGINLVAANRVIIFDVSWNPSHDIQSIYRVYRFGQTKPCYIYRFVTYGTMEMKIYERQVIKQAISKRVIDEQQIDRHYNQNDLQELYKFEPKPENRPIPLVPKDVLLGEMLQKYEDRIYQYHEHQSLLENKEEETLDESERKAAWEEFENEKQNRNARPGMFLQNLGITAPHLIHPAITSLLQKRNPNVTDEEIRLQIPYALKELQQSIAMGKFELLVEVQKEIQLIQAVHAQQYKDQMYRQQAVRLLQQQRLQEQQRAYQREFVRSQIASTSQRPNHNSTDVIELND